MKEYVLHNSDIRMRYHDLPGEKTPVIFIHGLGCAGSSDYPQVAAQTALAAHRRILVDLIGSGFSDKPGDFDYSIQNQARYLKEFIDDLAVKSFCTGTAWAAL